MATSNPQSLWTYDLLWAKVMMYMERAFAVPRESDQFPFLASLALELLARASLAHLSPALLADTSDRDGRNLLYALGYEPKVRAYVPKSIQTSDVVTRCKQLVPGFTENVEKFCRALFNKRNEELHSGGAPFATLPNSLWLPRFYEAASVLLRYQERSLSDLVGPKEAKAADIMLKAVADQAAKSVKKLIKDHSKIWKGKGDEERTALQQTAMQFARPHRGHVVGCPACGSPALVTGEDISQQPPSLEDEELVVRTAVLPTEFQCVACGLRIHGHNQLHAADLGGQFTSTMRFDPVEYYAVDEWQEGPEEEYNND